MGGFGRCPNRNNEQWVMLRWVVLDGVLTETMNSELCWDGWFWTVSLQKQWTVSYVEMGGFGRCPNRNNEQWVMLRWVVLVGVLRGTVSYVEMGGFGGCPPHSHWCLVIVAVIVVGWCLIGRLWWLLQSTVDDDSDFNRHRLDYTIQFFRNTVFHDFNLE